MFCLSNNDKNNPWKKDLYHEDSGRLFSTEMVRPKNDLWGGTVNLVVVVDDSFSGSRDEKDGEPHFFVKSKENSSEFDRLLDSLMESNVNKLVCDDEHTCSEEDHDYYDNHDSDYVHNSYDDDEEEDESLSFATSSGAIFETSDDVSVLTDKTIVAGHSATEPDDIFETFDDISVLTEDSFLLVLLSSMRQGEMVNHNEDEGTKEDADVINENKLSEALQDSRLLEFLVGFCSQTQLE